MSDVIDKQQLELAIAGESLSYVEGSGGDLTLDRRWTPYIQGQFTVVSPADPSIFDPRAVPLLEVTWLQRFGPILQFVADLTVVWEGLECSDLTIYYAGDTVADISGTARRWFGAPAEPTSLRLSALVRTALNNFDGTHTLRVEGVEARYRDYPNPRPRDVTAPVSTLATFRAIYAELEASFPLQYPSLALEPGPDDVDLRALAVRDDQVVMPPGRSLFDAMQTFLGELRLWGSEEGKLLLTRPPATPPSVLTVTGATVVDASELVSIDDPAWGDGLLIEYAEKSTDPSVWNFVSYYPPDDWFGPVAKMLHVILPGASPFSDLNAGFLPWPEGDQLYKPTLDRAQRRYRSLPVRAVNNFDARPDAQVILPDLPATPSLQGIVTATTWRVDDGEMVLTLEGIEET